MTAAATTANPVGHLARFELLRLLGRGAQAKVWLAHDPRLDREVALKLLDPDADAAAVSLWMHEARAVSRLTHPNIVPVFEADDHGGQSYLVFEFVDGPTLAQARQGKKGMPAREAAALMVGVLDALAAAHDQGIVHRDLKPSNILLGSDGRARVMDFGIAARVAHGPGATSSRRSAAHDPTEGRIVGTPGYISPEAARGEPPVPAMDVFAAGVLLGELLSGGPLLRETDPYRAVERVQREDLVLPAHVKVDEQLRGIVQRALSRDIAGRYDSARSMHTALNAWLNPEASADPGAGSSHATLEFLLRRMKHKTDFPALSSSVVRIQRVATSETESLKTLTDEILKDVALTNKLLRMVNTAHFTAVAGGGVSTVSRAVSLVGFAGIRNMALSVVLLEHMSDKVHASQLKEEFLRALMAGTLADELTPLARESEESFLGAMFQNLGRLLTECYLPEEAVQIRQALKGRADHHAAGPEREAAAQRVLGLTLDELGAGVAKAWGLPEGLQRALSAPAGEQPSTAERGVERLRWLGRGANAMADAMLGADGQAQADALRAVADLYAPVLGLQARDMVTASYATRSRLAQLAQAMGVHVAPGAPARRLLEATGISPAADLDAKTVFMPAAGTTPAAVPADVLNGAAVSEPQRLLAATLEDVRQALAQRKMTVPELLQRVLVSMHQAIGFRCVVLCLREPGSGRLVGRIGLGAGAGEMSKLFKITPDAAAVADLFGWLCAKGADLLITDARTVATRLPPWYRQRINAPSFLLLPLMVKGLPIGLVYADPAQPAGMVLAEGELAALRALRDQAAAAMGKGS